MRVLMISKACIVGVYQRKLEEMARLPEIDVLHVLVPPAWKDERGTTYLERVYVEGYTLQVTPIRFNGNFHLHYYPEAGAYIRTMQPDIIHIDEEPYNLSTWLVLRAAHRVKARTLFFSWQNIKRNYPPPFSWFEKYTLNTVDYALMGTESAADIWREKGYQKPLTVVPQFGVDPDIFFPAERQATAESVTIGYIGRLVPEKGIDVLLKALAGLLNFPWQLEIVGSGPSRVTLMQQIEQSGFEERVHWTDWLPSVDMPDRYRALDVLVIPSRTMSNWKEQFGRVIIEAMASGVVVIGSDSGAIPDVIGDAGLVFPEDDVSALKDHLKLIIEDAAEHRCLAEKGRSRVLEQFTQEQVARQTVAAYQQVLTGLLS